MPYSINSLTTVADCDTLLANAEGELKALRRRVDNLDYARDSTSEASAETQAAIASLDAEITALTTVIPTLAEGTTTRKNSETDSRTATFRRVKLNDRQEARNPVALLLHERNLAETQVQIVEVEAFITVVTARKAAL